MNLFEDAYAALAEEDSAPGDKGTTQAITPYQSFTDLVYSKGKRVTAVAWVPGKKGMVAVACTLPLSADERLVSSPSSRTHALLQRALGPRGELWRLLASGTLLHIRLAGPCSVSK
jgi:hypothetical protein